MNDALDETPNVIRSAHSETTHAMLIGAAKAGTSSLYHHLAQHPQIYASPKKEPRYFLKPSRSDAERREYEQLFGGRSTEPCLFESPVAYTACTRFRGVPERIQAMIPQARLIYAIRNPVERVVSQYLNRVTAGRERRGFEEAVLQDPPRYIDQSRYYLQISQFLLFFPREQIHVLVFEDFLRDKEGSIAAIFKFLGVDDAFIPSNLSQRFNESDQKSCLRPSARRLDAFVLNSPIPYRVKSMARARLRSSRIARIAPPGKKDLLTPEIADRLRAMLRDDAAQVRGFLGRDLAEWDI